MGMSADAYLMYGYAFGSIDRMPEEILNDYGNVPSWLEYGEMRYEDVEVEMYGYIDGEEAYALVVSDSISRAWEYGHKYVDLDALARERYAGDYDAKLDAVIESLNITIPDSVNRGWILAASYG